MTADIYHVLPVNDLKPHSESAVIHYQCQPEFRQVENSTVIIHNSFDGREFFEDEHSC